MDDRAFCGMHKYSRFKALIPPHPVSTAHLLQAVRAAGKCETVFKGFSDCLLELGENMANYPQELDEKRNIETICG